MSAVWAGLNWMVPLWILLWVLRQLQFSGGLVGTGWSKMASLICLEVGLGCWLNNMPAEG